MPRICDHERDVVVHGGRERSYCKKCHYAKIAERKLRVKAEVREKITEYLNSHPCVDCGYDVHIALHFDHIDPASKKLSIAKMYSRAYKWEAILQEIAKCEVRCANCHALRTAEQFGWWNNASIT